MEGGRVLAGLRRGMCCVKMRCHLLDVLEVDVLARGQGRMSQQMSALHESGASSAIPWRYPRRTIAHQVLDSPRHFHARYPSRFHSPPAPL